ncbi:tRNA dimethylallyltransferase [Trichinella spiralis]|uniref:tRNA dimethylallyltransferase n=1 Tax=Trichinella spiralis TaxID=6334 RepID=A0ABR3KJP4_TRISP
MKKIHKKERNNYCVGRESNPVAQSTKKVVHLLPTRWSIVQRYNFPILFCIPSPLRVLFLTVILQLTNGQVEIEENLTSTIKRSSSFFGIPVPGNSISGTDVLQLYVRSCKPGFEELPQGDILSSTIKMLADGHGEQFLQKMYSELFFAIQSIDPNKLAGKWYRVMDSSGFYDEICSVVDIKIIEQSQGEAFKIGPDPGGFLYFTGRQEDVCPYFIVKTGALNSEQKYEYVILSQLFKTPVLVLARDPRRFALQYKNEVKNFFKQNDFAKSPWDNDNTATLSHFDHVNCVSSYDDF